MRKVIAVFLCLFPALVWADVTNGAGGLSPVPLPIPDTQVTSSAVPGQTTVNGALTSLNGYAATLTNGGCVNPVAGSATYALTFNCALNNGYLGLSAGSLYFCPHQGNSLFINGSIITIPSACATLTNSGLSASTYYYIYAYSNSGTLTLEASTTGHSTNTTYGYEQKTGDATRALVGAAYTDGSVAFQDTATQRYVASWFNPQQKRCINQFTTGRATSSASYVEVNSEIRCQFIVMGPPSASKAVANPLIWHISGTMTNGTIADGCAVSAGFDSASPQTEQTSYANANLASATMNAPLGLAGTVTTITETGGTSGLHYMTFVAKVTTGGTCTFASAYASIEVDIWQ